MAAARVQRLGEENRQDRVQHLTRNIGKQAREGQKNGVPRNPGEIGMHALRVGDTVGEHTVSYGNLGETITIGGGLTQ